MEALQSKDVNIFSYHYYSGENARFAPLLRSLLKLLHPLSGLDFLRIATEATYLRQFGKA